MPENEKPFKQIKEDVLTAGREGRDYDFAALEGRLATEKIQELQRIWKFEKLKRAAQEAGRLGEDIDCVALEQEWDAREIGAINTSYSYGKFSNSERITPGPKEDEKNLNRPRYELWEKIGCGAFGTVYKARDFKAKWTDRQIVAIKIQRSLWKKMSRDEARRIRSVRSPYVVEVEDVGELKRPDGNPEFLSRLKDELKLLGCPQLNTEDRRCRTYLVMELIDGKTLKKKITPGQPIDEDQVRIVCGPKGWMYGCCRGMYEVHDANIIHRDLKPENIFIQRGSNKVKIGDFGLAKLMPADDLPPEKNKPEEIAEESSTAPGTFKYFGTKEYMAPEHWKGKAEMRSDIYSFGATFYEVLTGQPPFEHPDIDELRRMHAEDIPEKPISLNPNISPEISALIMKCLEKSPSSRHHSFKEIERYLEDLPPLREGLEHGYDLLKKNPHWARQKFSKLTGSPAGESSAEAFCGLGEACLIEGNSAEENGSLKTAEIHWSDCITAFNVAIALRSYFSRPYYYRGVAHKKTGNTEQSKTDLKKAKELGYTPED